MKALIDKFTATFQTWKSGYATARRADPVNQSVTVAPRPQLVLVAARQRGEQVPVDSVKHGTDSSGDVRARPMPARRRPVSFAFSTSTSGDRRCHDQEVRSDYQLLAATALNRLAALRPGSSIQNSVLSGGHLLSF